MGILSEREKTVQIMTPKLKWMQFNQLYVKMYPMFDIPLINSCVMFKLLQCFVLSM